MRSVALIQLLEDIDDKEYVLCNIHYVAGAKSGLFVQQAVPVMFFNYHNYGFVIELVETGCSDIVHSISDLKYSDLKGFNITIEPGISYDIRNHSIESRDRFKYKLEDSLMCRKLGTDCIQHIENALIQAKNAGIIMYLINGALLSVAILSDVKKESYFYKYSMGAGSVLTDKKVLNTVIPYHDEGVLNDNPLNQKEIDELLRQLHDEKLKRDNVEDQFDGLNYISTH